MNRIEVIEGKNIEFGGLDGYWLILRDIQTGVLYLSGGVGRFGGTTLLVDTDGKPLVLKKCPECGCELDTDTTSCPECGCPID